MVGFSFKIIVNIICFINVCSLLFRIYVTPCFQVNITRLKKHLFFKYCNNVLHKCIRVYR